MQRPLSKGGARVSSSSCLLPFVVVVRLLLVCGTFPTGGWLGGWPTDFDATRTARLSVCLPNWLTASRCSVRPGVCLRVVCTVPAIHSLTRSLVH